ncbi:MAG: spore coat associated protein CotJA [Oscillospiraceae bacterium]|jgi:hypothetical protein|nr:spore coat associated protein CotJA [Oscillospiraceae bacterium]
MDEQIVANTSAKTLFPSATPPAMAYVPYQQYSAGYQPEEAYQNGTLFPELNQPFYGERGFSV